MSLLQDQSLLLLNVQLFWNIIVYFGVSPLTLLSNCLVTLVLYKGRHVLKSHHYKLLFHTAIITSLLSIDVISFLGVKKVYQTLSNIPDVLERWICCLFFVSYEFLLIVDSFNVIFVSFDRFMAAVRPMWYKNINSHKTYRCISICVPYVVAVLMLTFKFSFYSFEFSHATLVVCVIPSTYPPIYSNLFLAASALVSIFALTFYSSAVMLVLYKVYKNSENSKKLKKETGFRLLITSLTDAAIYICSYVISIIFTITVIPSKDLLTQVAIGPIALGFYMLSVSPRFIVMYVLNRDFRHCFQSLFMKNKVFTISTTFKQTTNSSKY